MANALPAEHKFPQPNPFAVDGNFDGERVKEALQEEFSLPGPWRWHYYFQGPDTTLDQVMQIVAEGIEGFIIQHPKFARSEADLALVAVSKEKPTSGW